MTGQTVILGGERAMSAAMRVLLHAPAGSVMTVKPPTRSPDQNAKMWAMLSDISRAKPEGRVLTPKVWKTLFMHQLDHELRFEMALDGNGMVPIDYSTSQLSKARMSDLIEKMYEYGAKHNVEWTNERDAAA